jgi:hypothetical protein
MPKFAHFLYLLPLCLSFIFSIKTFRKKWAKPYQLFSIFLIITLIIELFAISWKLFLHQTGYWSYTKSNLWIYNLYLVPQYLFYFLFFSAVLDNRFLKKVCYPVAIIYFAFGLANICFVQSMKQLDTYTIISGSILVLFCAVSYFIQEINRKEPVRVTADPLFWISLGSFIFHTVSLPYFISINYLSRTNLPMAIALFNILLVLNILMYSFYLIAFLCNNPFQKKLS